MSFKVYAVMQYDAQPLESYHDGINAVFSTKEAALGYLTAIGEGPHWIDEEICDGYYLSNIIKELEVYN